VRDFSLSGLLRLRRLQQNAAGGELLRARSRASELAAQRTHVRDAVLGAGDDSDSIATMHAIAAARSSTSSMLADLSVLEAEASRTVDAAAREHAATRRAVLSIEKLEERHRIEERIEELRNEQNVLDELALRGTPRAQHDALDDPERGDRG
jgi:flagellar FliJ protein